LLVASAVGAAVTVLEVQMRGEPAPAALPGQFGRRWTVGHAVVAAGVAAGASLSRAIGAAGEDE